MELVSKASKVPAPLALALLLALSLLAGVGSQASLSQFLEERLKGDFQTVLGSVEAHLAVSDATVAGGIGLFGASRSVERDEWHAYFYALPEDTRSSIEAFAFARVVPADGIPTFEASVRADDSVVPGGHPDFSVWPPRDDGVAFVLDYVVQTAGAPVMGWDLASQEDVREVAELARDAHEVFATPPLFASAHEGHGDFALIGPVYANGAPTATRDERRAALQGFVVGIVDSESVFSTIVAPSGAGFELEVFDVGPVGLANGTTSPRLISDRSPEGQGEWAGGTLHFQTTVEFGGRWWDVAYAPGPNFAPAVTPYAAWIVTGFGMVVSILVVATLVSVQGSRQRAVELANHMTEELRESEARFRTLTEATSEAIVIHAGGRIIESNDAAVVLLGAPLVGRRVLDFVAPEDQELVQANIRHGGSDSYRATAVRGDGVRVEVEVRGKDIPWRGKPARATTLRDVTEHRRLETLQQLAKEAAESAAKAAIAASEAKTTFLTNMSHEIRTPMNAIIGMATLLAERDLGTEARRELDTIRASGEHLLSLINDLLDLAKVEAGKVDLEKGTVVVVDVVESALEVARVRAAEKDIELTYWLSEEVPLAFEGDERRVRQVLINLIGNAVKFTERGEVHVHVTADPAVEGVAWVRFAVRDTGPGMTPETLERLFRPFQQADATITRTHGGTGLGLAIAKHLVTAMGGRVGVDSTPGEGSTFHVALPVRPVAPPQVAPLLRGPPGNLLVVAPNANTRRIVEAAAREAGWSVTGATSLDAAILREALPDIIIVDDHIEPAPAVAAVKAETPDARIVVMGQRGERAARWSEALAAEVPMLSKPARRASVANILGGGTPHAVQGSQTEPPRSAFDATLAQAHPHNILVVDDNAVNLDVALAYLRRLGYDPSPASDGVEAIALARRMRPDIIFMDLQMPIMDGLTASRAILQDPWDGAPPRIIALTAHALRAERDRCLSAGMSGYLTKPIDIASLVAVLREGAPAASAAAPASPSPAASAPVSPSPAPSRQGIEEAVLREMVDGLGAPVAAKLVRSYLADSPRLIEELAKALDEERIPEAVRAAHTLAGTSLSFGAQALGEAARAFERQAAGEDAPRRRDRLADLRRLHQEAAAALAAYA